MMKIVESWQASDGWDVRLDDGSCLHFHGEREEPKDLQERVEQIVAAREAVPVEDPETYAYPPVGGREDELAAELEAVTAERDKLLDEKADLLAANSKLTTDLAAAKRAVR